MVEEGLEVEVVYYNEGENDSLIFVSLPGKEFESGIEG